MENKESSLTLPEDRDQDPSKRWRPQSLETIEVLTDESVAEAEKLLIDNSFRRNFPSLDRVYTDPLNRNQLSLALQKIALFSFAPAKGAKPNERGVYGMAKIRGVFETDIEAEARSRELIKNFDSYNKIYFAPMFRPFPVTCESTFSGDVSEVDMKKEIAGTVADDVQKNKEKEEREIKGMRERQKKLMEESKRAEAGTTVANPFEEYTSNQVKRSNLIWTYLEHEKKKEEIKAVLTSTRRVLAEVEAEHPEFKDMYYEKYMEARREAGFVENEEQDRKSFMHYLLNDVRLDFEQDE